MTDPDRCPSGVHGDQLEIKADAVLLRAGWERRFLADPDRAREAMELYSSLGYEVKAKKLSPADFGELCRQCPAASCLAYVMIYTRRKV